MMKTIEREIWRPTAVILSLRIKVAFKCLKPVKYIIFILNIIYKLVLHHFLLFIRKIYILNNIKCVFFQYHKINLKIFSVLCCFIYLK